MKVIELQPMKEWEEKESDRPTGNIRIYIGSLHVGTACRKNKLEELYSFHSLYLPVTERMNTTQYRPLVDVKMDIECCWKEFAPKFLKSLKTYTAISDFKPASPNRKFAHPGKKDGNGKR